MESSNENKILSENEEDKKIKQLEFAQKINMMNYLRFAKMQRIKLNDPNVTNQNTNSFKKYKRTNPWLFERS